MRRKWQTHVVGARRRGGLHLLVLAVWAGLVVIPSPAPAGAVVSNPVPSQNSKPGAASAVPTGLARLASAATSSQEPLEGIATFGGRQPTEAQRQALAKLGLQVRFMRHLPLALVRGSWSQLQAAVREGIATDVYPNERLQYFSATSTRSLGADRVRVEGVTGRGVGVAIVDSGIDGTHPDLADHVTHNMKIIGLDALNRQGAGSLAIAVPVDQGPYNNTDLTSGHGTHVAGIVAADAHTSPDQVGVAPDASLIGYGAGDFAFVVAQLVAFDDILEHHQAWGIRVVNNSWGDSFRPFDPGDPVNVATRALNDAGIVVVFAAGNDAEEMQLNPYSAAPWVISVASGTTSKVHSEFSSGGIEFDNSLPQASAAPHTRFEGDRIGLYHPDVTAPGTKIVSSATPTGLYAGASPQCLARGAPVPPCTATSSGTSMAAPHVAGVAALVLGVRPELTPDDVRRVLQVTASPMNDASPFWQSGYGFVDAASAVALVRRPDFGPELLTRLQEAADARVRSRRSFAVASTEFWHVPAPPVIAGTYKVSVTPDTRALKAVAAFPCVTCSQLQTNPFTLELTFTLKDASGEVVAEGEVSRVAGTATLFADLSGVPSSAFGTWTLEFYGFDVSGGEKNADFVTVTAARLVPASTG